MESDFPIHRSMLIALCNAVLAGELNPEALREIGFALVSSDRFQWDGEQDEVLTEIINDWSCPEVDYPLTMENVRRCKAWLTGEEAYPVKTIALAKHWDRIVSIRMKKQR